MDGRLRIRVIVTWIVIPFVGAHDGICWVDDAPVGCRTNTRWIWRYFVIDEFHPMADRPALSKTWDGSCALGVELKAIIIQPSAFGFDL